MAKITYIEADGTEYTVDVKNGESVMQAAVDNDISGIVAECGGACACATCHCYIDEQWTDKIPSAKDLEQDMLECAAEPQDNSRLSCQITVTDELDGLIVRLPESQY